MHKPSFMATSQEKFSFVVSRNPKDPQQYVAHNHYPACVLRPIWAQNEWQVQLVDNRSREASPEELWEVSMAAIFWLHDLPAARQQLLRSNQ